MKKMLFILFTGLLFSACNQNQIYSERQGVDNLRWSSDNVLAFQPTIENTDATYNLLVSIRYYQGIPYDELPLEVTMLSPAGDTTRYETVVKIKEGETYQGSGMGDIWDLDASFAEGITFSESGSYNFTIQHVAATDPFVMVSDIGLIIEKAQ